MTLEQTEFLRKTQDLYLHQKQPVVVINTSLAPCFVPHDLVQNNILNINIHPRVVSGFRLENRSIKFKAFFDSKSYALEIPLLAIEDVIEGEV